jgi:hypothetical protein
LVIAEGADANNFGRQGFNFRVTSTEAEMADYRIGRDGTIVTILTERAANRGSGAKPTVGMSIAFKTRHDTGSFVRAGEAEGYTFEGKEALAGV